MVCYTPKNEHRRSLCNGLGEEAPRPESRHVRWQALRRIYCDDFGGPEQYGLAEKTRQQDSIGADLYGKRWCALVLGNVGAL